MEKASFEIFKTNIDKVERLTRRERLGELLVREKILSLPKLVELMELSRQEKVIVPFGEYLVINSLLTMPKLVELLNLQKAQARVIDACLEELGLMTNEKKWENLTRHNKLGEILIRHGSLNLEQLVEGIKEQEASPEKLLGDILLEMGYITKSDLKNAVEEQYQQNQTLQKIIQEITNASQLPITIKVRRMNTFWGR